MNYSDMIRRSFRTMRSGPLWGFAASVTAARMVLMLLALAAVNAVGESGIARAVMGISPWAVPNTAVVQIGYLGAVMIGSILAIPISLVMLSGLTHLTDEVIAGRPARVSEGWSFGGRYMGRMFAIELVVTLISFVVFFVCAIPLVLAAIGGAAASAGSRGGSFNPIPLIAGICCGYLLFLVLVIFATLFLAAYGSLAIRYAVIGDRTTGDALGSAFKAMRARWKNVFVYSLIQFGFGFVWVAVMVAVSVPLQLVTGATQKLPTLSHMLGAYSITGPITAALSVPLLLLTYSMWTAFFRQMTGLDAAEHTPPMYAPPQPGYAPPPPGYAPQPPYAPPQPGYAPPQPPYAPAAPEPWTPAPQPIPMAPGAPGVPESRPPAPPMARPAPGEPPTEGSGQPPT